MLKGAIVGLGYIAGKGHLPAYLKMKDVRIVAVADLTPARLELARQMIPGVRTYASHEALLEAEDELDFIDIATPPSDHAAIALAAAARGVNVLCEKPLTTSTAQAQKLLQTAARRKVVIFPCHNYKHAPVIHTVREILAAGTIGEVTTATLNTYRPTHAKGVAEWLPDWRRMRRYSGGGIAMDHGSHSFYLMFLFMGAYPTSVAAKAFTVESKWDTEDNVAAALTFPRGFANVLLTWTAGARKVIYTIQGTKGAITISDDDFELATANGPEIKVEKRTIVSAFNDASHTSWFTSLFESFRAAIENHDYVSRELEEAFLCCHLIERIYDSAAKQCRELPIDSSFDFLRRPAAAKRRADAESAVAE
jgi:predicted dehydrogenase